MLCVGVAAVWVCGLCRYIDKDGEDWIGKARILDGIQFFLSRAGSMIRKIVLPNVRLYFDVGLK